MSMRRLLLRAVGECNEEDSTEKCNSRNYCTLHIAHISHDFQLLKEINFPFAMLIEYYYDFMLIDINTPTSVNSIINTYNYNHHNNINHHNYNHSLLLLLLSCYLNYSIINYSFYIIFLFLNI